MKFDFMNALLGLSFALDCVEQDLLGATTFHGKRVAVMCIWLGRHYNLTEEQLMELVSSAVLHDCALSEYIREEYNGSLADAKSDPVKTAKEHCIRGEQYLKNLPFADHVKDVILYHHENEDGTGPFGKQGREIPLYARLIHIADIVDVTFALGSMNEEKRRAVMTYLKQKSGAMYKREDAEVLYNIFKEGTMTRYLDSMELTDYLQDELPDGEISCTPQQLIDFASLFAAIVDYKSHFTKTHSIGIARKAKKMAAYYDQTEEMQAKLYFAGALHDIGKMVVDRDVLEKPDKLTAKEYEHIQTHAYYTYHILRPIRGLEDITHWAGFHHEKLDGTGYPFELKAPQLDRWDRLMACLDIYQALTEERPYKDKIKHDKAIDILQDMVENGKLDGDIVKDIDFVFGQETMETEQTVRQE